MNRIALVIGGGLIAVGLSVGAFAHEGNHKESTEGKPVTVQGELVDTACFITSDGDAKGMDHAACATKCMASGVPAAILPEGSKDADAAMFLLTNPQVLAPYAAQTIKVEGTAFEDKHAIDVKKLYVKDGDNWKEVQLKDEHHKMGGDKASDKNDMGGMKMDKK
jgi:hypothetical protein